MRLKHKNILKFRVKIAAVVAVVATSALIAINVGTVSAAPPGCYNRLTTGTVRAVPCNNVDLTAAVIGGRCFLSQTVSGATTPFVDTPCANITVTGAQIPSAGCYNGTSAASVRRVSCNDLDILRAVNAGRCFLSITNSAGITSAFVDTPCGNMALASTTGLPPIPAGCPGSTAQGPPAPGVCVSIPMGCPGSTQQGPVASTPVNCPYAAAAPSPTPSPSPSPGPSPSAAPAAELDNATFTPAGQGDDCNDPNGIDSGNCKIIEYILIFTNALAAIVGTAIVAIIVFAGIKYSTAGDDPKAIAEAKDKIKNAIVALVMFIFMFAFLQWVVPGGVF
jgi:Type IV secretion system pilin